MAIIRVCMFFAALILTSVAVTPIEKVIKLLDDMQAEVESDGTKAAVTYETFACWCKNTTQTKYESIIQGGDEIGTLSATIADKTSEKVMAERDVLELKAAVEMSTKELQDETLNFQYLKANYSKKEADMKKAVSSLQAAIAAMKKKKGAIGKYSGLLAVRKTIAKSLAVADALSLISPPKRQAMSALLQEDPADATYTYHSDDIVKMLEDLEKQFTEQKSALDTEWAKTDTSHKDMAESISKSIETKTNEIGTREIKIDTLSSEIGDAKGSLVDAQVLLRDDQTYMKDMTTQCETAAAAWDQQSKMRSDEIEAITTAVQILKGKVTPATEKVVRALLLSKNATLKVASKPAVARSAKPHVAAAAAPIVKSKPHSFLQTQRTATFSEMGQMRAEERRDRAIAVLQRASNEINSPVLAAIASQIRADPFKKVKDLIQKLIVRLIRESTEEASKKGFCDTLIGETTKERMYRLADVKRLNAKSAALEVKEDELTAEIDELGKVKIPDLAAALEKTSGIRADDKKANLETISTAKEGLSALKEAITVLKEFYEKAGKSTVFLQKSSYVKEIPEFMASAYTGKQSGSVAVLALLEQIKDDFKRTITKTTSEEEAAVAEQIKFERMSKSDLKGYETKKTLDEEDLRKTRREIETTMSELSDQMKLVDAALKTLETARSTCTDSGMSHAERGAKREEEIAALKKAVCILDTENVEKDC